MIAWLAVIVVAVHAGGVDTEPPARALAASLGPGVPMDARVAELLRDDYAPLTPQERARALALVPRMFEAGFANREQALQEVLAVLRRNTEPDFEVDLAIHRVEAGLRELDVRVGPAVVLDGTAVTIEPLGFLPGDDPKPYVDGAYAQAGTDGVLRLRFGVHHVHLRCGDRRCSRTRRIDVASSPMRLTVPALSLAANLAPQLPVALRYPSTIEQNRRVIPQALALLAVADAPARVLLVITEGRDLRLVLVGAEGVAATARVTPEELVGGAERVLRGEIGSAVEGPSDGKVAVRVERLPAAPDIVGVRSVFDARPSTRACPSTPCLFHAPPGQLSLRFSDVDVDDRDSREIEVRGDAIVRVHPARGARGAAVGRTLFAAGLGIVVGAAVYGLIAKATCEGTIGALPGGADCEGAVPIGTFGSAVLAGGGVMALTGVGLILRFRPFRVEVEPVLRR